MLAILDACGFTFIDHSVSKLERRIFENTFLHEKFKCKFLQCLGIVKASLPFLIHFHHAVFYWDGTYYNIAKRLTGIKYVSRKNMSV